MTNNFQRRWHETSGWILADYNFNEEFSKLRTLCLQAENEIEFLVIKQWFYKCASTPDLRFCFDLEDLDGMIKNMDFHAGDIMEIFVVKKADFSFKCPDENGLIPERGAY